LREARQRPAPGLRGFLRSPPDQCIRLQREYAAPRYQYPPSLKMTKYAPRQTAPPWQGHGHRRSEEHTSELQSRFDLVCRLLLEKKKKNKPAKRRRGKSNCN